MLVQSRNFVLQHSLVPFAKKKKKNKNKTFLSRLLIQAWPMAEAGADGRTLGKDRVPKPHLPARGLTGQT